MGVGGISVMSSGSPLVTIWHRCAVVDRHLVVLDLSKLSIGAVLNWCVEERKVCVYRGERRVS